MTEKSDITQHDIALTYWRVMSFFWYLLFYQRFSLSG